MKIEIGESLATSFLKHVHGCRIVQTNWKTSDRWVITEKDKGRSKKFFDRIIGSNHFSEIFKGSSFNQLLKQAEIDVLGINTSESTVYGIDVAFHGAKSFNQPLNNWDVSIVANMKEMFRNAESFNQPLNNWDVSSVTSMRGMFAEARSFNQPLDSWDISSDTDTSEMFLRSTPLSKALLGGLNEKKIKKITENEFKKNLIDFSISPDFFIYGNKGKYNLRNAINCIMPIVNESYNIEEIIGTEISNKSLNELKKINFLGEIMNEIENDLVQSKISCVVQNLISIAKVDGEVHENEKILIENSFPASL